MRYLIAITFTAFSISICFACNEHINDDPAPPTCDAPDVLLTYRDSDNNQVVVCGQPGVNGVPETAKPK